ncbi:MULTISPECIES: hypothetical protein [Pseudomonas]|uniref:hypothetical protein n=1 Tax=Pseudomonas TaxID=286 RepID=UPI001FC9A16C|nr:MULTISPECIES: hypothetical protein [Pseudomonas]
MELQLLDRMSFQRFVGLNNSARVPGRTEIAYKAPSPMPKPMYTKPCASKLYRASAN